MFEGKLETARKMKDGGLSIRQIAEFTGLSIEEFRDCSRGRSKEEAIDEHVSQARLTI